MTKHPTKNPAAQALGALGGAANTPAQLRQRQAAAQKAGRPRRVCARCGQPVLGGHADRALDATCGAHGWRWQRAGLPLPTPPTFTAAARAVNRLLASMAGDRLLTQLGTPRFVAKLARVMRDASRAPHRS